MRPQGLLALFPSGVGSKASWPSMTDTVDASELLGIDVDQFARALALVANDGRAGVERRQPAETVPAQHGANRGKGPAELAGNARTTQAPTPQRDDGGFLGAGQPGRAVMRARRAIDQARLALGDKAIAPFADCLAAHAQRPGDRCNRPAVPETLHHQHSTMPGRSRILMDVHPWLRSEGYWCGNHSIPPLPRMDNLHSNDTYRAAMFARLWVQPMSGMAAKGIPSTRRSRHFPSLEAIATEGPPDPVASGHIGGQDVEHSLR